jgi:hypothetical protein
MKRVKLILKYALLIFTLLLLGGEIIAEVSVRRFKVGMNAHSITSLHHRVGKFHKSGTVYQREITEKDKKNRSFFSIYLVAACVDIQMNYYQEITSVTKVTPLRIILALFGLKLP